VFKRTMVILAGPLMNFLTAILLFFVVYWATGTPELKQNSTEIGVISPGAPAEKAGLTVGSKILTIDGAEFKDFNDMAGYIKERPNQDIAISWSSNDSVKNATLKTLEVMATDSLGQKKAEGRIGIGPVFTYKPIGMGQALKDGFDATVFMTGQMFTIIWRLITQQESIKSLGGPVMIAQQAGAAAKQGFVALLGLAAFLSVNLAILNVLPIPVLDGGHLVFLAIEAFKKKPVSIKSRLIAQQIGMGLLFLLMIMVTYNDIVRLATGVFN
jgi:regulator of sigma E protease